MNRILPLLVLIFFPVFSLAQNENYKHQVKTGAEVLISEYLHLIEGKKLGIITNSTSVLSNGTHLIDTLLTFRNVNIKALFAPEHGIRINAADGDLINDTIDVQTGLRVFSLYTENKKPTPEMLKDIDLLIFDLQDVGVRFYTTISTLLYSLQAAAENKIPILILDRPNPINGIGVDGPIRVEEVAAFTAIAPLPVMYGMTIGELAQFYAGEKLVGEINVDLKIIKLKDWERNYFYDDLNLPWIKTSPNIPTPETAMVYPGTCLIEGTNLSEGRGTENPFLTIGAPFVDAEKLIAELESLNIAGVDFSPAEFTPKEIPGVAANPKHNGVKCYGIKIRVVDKQKFLPLQFGVKLICSLKKLFADSLTFRDYFDTLIGNRKVRQQILKGDSADQISSGWKEELQIFSAARKKYLLY